MKGFLFFPVLFLALICHGQENKERLETPTFSYSHKNAASLFKDSQWVYTNTKLLFDYINNNSAGTLKQADAFMLQTDKIGCHIILNNPTEALALTQNLYASTPGFSKVWYALSVGYFEMLLANSNYYTIAKSLFTRLKPDLTEKRLMQAEHTGNQQHGFSFMRWATNDTAKLTSLLSAFIPDIGRPNKTFTFQEMEDIIYVVSSRKVALAIKTGQNRLAIEVRKEVEKEAGFYKAYWDKREYTYQAGDKPTSVTAANLQAFDKVDFPYSQLWVNKKEIAGNGIDDDRNGIVDDLHGFMFNPENHHEKLAISLDRTKAKAYFHTPAINPAKIHNHGTMTVELMLKANPHVKIMGLEHWQYDSIWTHIQKNYTQDIAHNRFLIDSLIALRLKCWKQIVAYCREQNVRVTEINSMGFMLNGTEWDFGTGTGKDSIDRKMFAEEKFWQLVKGYNEIFSEAPNTLFVIAAGNEAMNNSDTKYLNMNIKGDNLINIGAVGNDFKKASYSNYGKDIDVYAPAHFLLKSKNIRSVESSGTSAASPVVCNLALKLVSLKPGLTPQQLKKLIIDGADKGPFEPGINIINPGKTVLLMKRMYDKKSKK